MVGLMWRPLAIAALLVPLAGSGDRGAALAGSVSIPIAAADLAAAAGLQRDDPSTIGLDIVRLAFASPNATAGEAAARQAIAAALSSTGQASRIPLPLAAETWRRHVLRSDVPDDRLAASIFGARGTALLYYGLMGMDPATLAWIDAHPSVLDAMVRHPGNTAAFARSIRIRNDVVVTPGEHAEDLWSILVGADPRQPAAFIARLLDTRTGRALMLYDAVAHLDPPHQRFALGLPDAADRITRAQRLLDAVARESPGWQVDDRPFLRADVDIALLFRLIAVDDAGTLQGPALRRVWARGFDVRETGDGPVDAAWLAATVLDAGGAAPPPPATPPFPPPAPASGRGA